MLDPLLTKRREDGSSTPNNQEIVLSSGLDSQRQFSRVKLVTASYTYVDEIEYLQTGVTATMHTAIMLSTLGSPGVRKTFLVTSSVTVLPNLFRNQDCISPTSALPRERALITLDSRLSP